MKEILITGANGMLGTSVCNYFSTLKDYNVTATSRKATELRDVNFIQGDLTSGQTIECLSKIKFDAVIHCAALTDIEESERHPDATFHINTVATENLVRTFSDSIFVYISTDSVFDGKIGNYSEDDTTNPLNIYARSKLDGEEAVKLSSEKYYILRTNMYGFHKPLSKRSLFEWAYNQLAKGEKIQGFSNVVFNPLYVGQLAIVIEKLISQNPPFGIYNAVCNEPLSKYDFLRLVVGKFNFSDDQLVAYELPERPVVALRAFKTYLENSKLRNVLPDLNLSIDTGLTMLYDDHLNYKKTGNE